LRFECNLTKYVHFIVISPDGDMKKEVEARLLLRVYNVLQQ